MFFFILFYFSVDAQNNHVQKLGQLQFENNKLNDVWGYHTQGNEYALVGLFEGVSIVNVTNPLEPNIVTTIPTESSVWKDIKTYKNYAYISQGVFNGFDGDNSNGAIIIADLDNIESGDIECKSFGMDYGLQTAHNLFIDTQKGHLYVFGANEIYGAKIFDISKDPLNPEFIGEYTDTYLHDGFVHENVLYGCADKNGYLAVVNVSDLNNIKTLSTVETPNRTTHNAWISKDRSTIFTTDEKKNAFITSFDISNLSNVIQQGKVRTDDFENAIPHNAIVMGDQLFSSYYEKGLRLFDVSDPKNMVEVASYSSNQGNEGQFEGVWGVYPFLPSGNILISDISTGLHIVNPDFDYAKRLI